MEIDRLNAVKITSNDFTFDSAGRIEMITDLESIVQKAERRLSTLRGEYPFDINLGLDEKGVYEVTDLERSKADIIQCLSYIPDILRVNIIELEYDSKTRKITGDIELITNIGQITTPIEV